MYHDFGLHTSCGRSAHDVQGRSTAPSLQHIQARRRVRKRSTAPSAASTGGSELTSMPCRRCPLRHGTPMGALRHGTQWAPGLRSHWYTAILSPPSPHSLLSALSLG